MSTPITPRTPTPSEWTVNTYAAYSEALRIADKEFQAERDRRYSEVNIEKEKALKIKETADLAALQLARDIQIYKDEKANELREQINRERVLYASKDDVKALAEKMETIVKPLTEYISSQQGRTSAYGISGNTLVAVIGAVAALVAIIYYISHLH